MTVALTVGLVVVAALALLLWPRARREEEFSLTLPPEAPAAKAGDRVRLRATADDGSALEGDFVVARASGAWLALRRR